MSRQEPGAHRHARPSDVRPAATRAQHALRSLAITLLVTGLVVVVTSVARPPAAFAAQAPVGLGTATSYAVMAGQAVSNTGPSVVSGDLSVSPGTAVTGFPPGLVQAGTVHAADAPALQGQNDLTTAYNDAAGRGPTVDQTDTDLGGQTLVAGAYHASTGMQLTGTLTLDAQGDPDAVFIFQAGSTLTTASGSTVELINGAQACRVFWQIGSSATIGTDTTLVGTVMALTSITAQTRATVQGRLLARNGSVTLDTNTITRPTCATPTPTSTGTSTGTSTVSPTPTTGPTTGPTGTGSPTTGPTGGTSSPVPTPPVTSTGPSPGTGVPGQPGSPPDSSTPTTPATPATPATPDRTSPPWVPQGHPPTGRAPSDPVALVGGGGGGLHGGWLGFGLMALGGVAGAAGRGHRPSRAH